MRYRHRGTWLIAVVVLLLNMTPLHVVTPHQTTVSDTEQDSVAVMTDIPQDWLSQTLDTIRQSEYHFAAREEEEGVYSAPNRAHNLRTTASSAGVHLTSRTASSGNWQTTLSLTSWGRVGSMTPVTPVSLTAQEHRIVYTYPGGLTEWYINTDQGLEQGFTIQEPGTMNANRTHDPLFLELAYSEEVTAVLDDGAIRFMQAGAPVLHYAKLQVEDALQRRLPARLALADNHRFHIVIDDTHATYPLTVDPLVTDPSWIAESNQDNPGFLRPLVDGIGDVNNDGFADVAVGFPHYDNGQEDEGVVFVYLGSLAGLSVDWAWMAESNQARRSSFDGVGFGHVAAAGDVNGDRISDLLIGAPEYNGAAGEDTGAVFLWLGGQPGVCPPSTSPSGLGPCGTPANAAWRAEGHHAELHFSNISIGTAGDVNGDQASDVLIGASFYANPEPWEGAVFLWLGGQPGICAPSTIPSGLGPCGNPDPVIGNAAWRAESNQPDTLGPTFGRASSAGDVDGRKGAGSRRFSDIIVGSQAYDTSVVDGGAAFVWLGGNLTDVCPPSTIPSGLGPCGNADIRSADYNAAWRAESNQSTSVFGGNVAMAGSVNGDAFSDIMIGARSYDTSLGRIVDSGAAFVWLGGNLTDVCPPSTIPSGLGPCGDPDPVTGNAAWRAEGGRINARLGGSLDTAGDVNNDLFSDVIINSQLTNPETREDAAFVWLGGQPGVCPPSTSPSGLGPCGNANVTDPSYNAAWHAEGNVDEARLGDQVSTAGDVNGDKCSDVLVNVRGYDNGEIWEGGAFVYYATCVPLLVCGNGTIDPGEACDDGNTDDGDGCSAACEYENVCGNGVLEPGEACDTGLPIPPRCVCSSDCRSLACKGNRELGEVDSEGPSKRGPEAGL